MMASARNLSLYLLLVPRSPRRPANSAKPNRFRTKRAAQRRPFLLMFEFAAGSPPQEGNR
jgi:hypothetical protein